MTRTIDRSLVLYRMYDDEGELLYVGKTTNLEQRLTTHKQEAPFYDDIDRIDLERDFADDAELSAAEKAAIQAEKPRHNVQDALTAMDRFTAKVRFTPTCWEWTASHLFSMGGRRNMKPAHVAGYILHGGEVPDGCHLRRGCGNTGCVNPAHMVVVGEGVRV